MADSPNSSAGPEHNGVLSELQEQIRRQNTFLNAVLESVTNPIYVVDAKDYTIKMANAAAQLSEDSGATTCYRLKHGRREPCGNTDYPCPVEIIKQTKKPVTVEHIHYDRHGGERNVEIHAFPMFDSHGDVAQIIQYSLDTTDRRRVERALRASEDRYRSYIEVTGQLGWTTNAVGEVKQDIPTWRRFTGQSEHEVMGWGWLNAVHPDDRRPTAQIWKNAVGTKSIYETEYRVRRHDGAYRYFMARGVPMFNEDRSIREWVGTCIDITDRREAEEALRTARDELELRVQGLK